MGGSGGVCIPFAIAGPAEQRVACPRCARSEPDAALGVNIELGIFQCFRCRWKGRFGSAASGPGINSIRRLADPAVAERRRKRLRVTWHETVPLGHPSAHAVRTYLTSRGLGEVLGNPPKVLRAHPGFDYWDGTQMVGQFPAMVALFHDASGDPVTLHVTYLRSDGGAKASVPAPKKILSVPVRGATKGGAIRLHNVRDGFLGIAEGVETALSLHLLHRVPVWSAYCANGLGCVALPYGLRKLLIGVDVDESGTGEAVAKTLAERLLHRKRPPEVFFIKPDGLAPRDLNDELMQRRAS